MVVLDGFELWAVVVDFPELLDVSLSELNSFSWWLYGSGPTFSPFGCSSSKLMFIGLICISLANVPNT